MMTKSVRMMIYIFVADATKMISDERRNAADIRHVGGVVQLRCRLRQPDVGLKMVAQAAENPRSPRRR